jgi:hypothetical protein
MPAYIPVILPLSLHQIEDDWIDSGGYPTGESLEWDRSAMLPPARPAASSDGAPGKVDVPAAKAKGAHLPLSHAVRFRHVATGSYLCVLPGAQSDASHSAGDGSDAGSSSDGGIMADVNHSPGACTCLSGGRIVCQAWCVV